ncbi:hypothetical protein GCM10023189_44160 [Nibrella saemangeumensis]|uniref:Uncharacterized protein n=1 Tax=Nibrella saemangeumensis TaxID=1084526 RepID=A0ABP8NBL8_9BACT
MVKNKNAESAQRSGKVRKENYANRAEDLASSASNKKPSIKASIHAGLV